jgi:uncharacterized membrane protein
MFNNRWLTAVLVVSLAGNLALAGFISGRLSGHGPAPAAMDPSLGLFRMLRELPDERREQLRPTVREHFRSMRGDLRDLRGAQRRINNALTAEPFEADALTAALDDFRRALLDNQRENHAMLVRVASTMSAEERALLRNSMTRRESSRHRPSGSRSDEERRRQ